MRELQTELWDWHGKPGHVVCITTNGSITKAGLAVMGRGCAAQAVERCGVNLKMQLALKLQLEGNVVEILVDEKWLIGQFIITFPVKHEWHQKADIGLIRKSAFRLREMADKHGWTFMLPRPGCGNGHLSWEDVKPVIAPILPDSVIIVSPPDPPVVMDEE